MIKELIDRHHAKTQIAYDVAKVKCGGFGGYFLWLDTRKWGTCYRNEDGPIDISCAPSPGGAWVYVGNLTAVEDDLVLEEAHRSSPRTKIAWNYAAPGCDRAILEHVIRVSLERCKWAGNMEVIRLDEEPSSNLGADR